MSRKSHYQAEFVELINRTEEIERTTNREIAEAEREADEAFAEFEQMVQFFVSKFGPSFIDKLNTEGTVITVDDQGVVHVERPEREASPALTKWADPRTN